MFHIMSSSAVSIAFDGSVRVFVSAAQQNPVGVRTIIVVEPGRLPLCHQFPESTLTIHPLAYLAGVVCGYAGLGVVIPLIVSGFSSAGIFGAPAT
jgi:hypothetical protein